MLSHMWQIKGSMEGVLKRALLQKLLISLPSFSLFSCSHSTLSCSLPLNSNSDHPQYPKQPLKEPWPQFPVEVQPKTSSLTKNTMNVFHEHLYETQIFKLLSRNFNLTLTLRWNPMVLIMNLNPKNIKIHLQPPPNPNICPDLTFPYSDPHQILVDP